MPIAGTLNGSIIGPPREASWVALNGGMTLYLMETVNEAWCARFTALSTKDLKTVRLHWTTITTAGTVTLRIETIDAATGKPTGTLYDANATIVNFTPVVGLQNYTFATLPTTGLVAGAEYGIVLITTGAGTTHSLSSGATVTHRSYQPMAVLTAVDGTTRSNFALVANMIPCVSIVWEDNSEDPCGMLPYYSYATNNIFTTNAGGSIITTSVPLILAGIQIDAIGKVGTPAGDLRIQILNTSNVQVPGTEIILDKDTFPGYQSHSKFPTLITLPAGTYRVVCDSAASANSSNCWYVRSVKFLHPDSVGSNFRKTTCPDIGIPVWTDNTTENVGINFLLDDIPIAAGGGLLTHPSMTGGIRG